MALHAVTGAFGYTGSYVAQQLLDAGETVITLTNSPNRPNPFSGKVRAYPFQFDDPEAMAESLAGVDVLYNTYWVRFNYGNVTHADAVRNTEALFTAAKRANVGRVVHVSIANADERSHLEYFQCKGYLERALKESGLSHAIIRPAVLFGGADILINNIAWTLRHFPLFAMFGDGRYHIQPIHVNDMARLMVEQAGVKDNVTLNALGVECYEYVALVKMMRDILALWRPILKLSPEIGYWASVLIGKMVGDIFVTRAEIEGLMDDKLYVPGAEALGKTKLSAWITENVNTLGKKYAGELPRRLNREKAY